MVQKQNIILIAWLIFIFSCKDETKNKDGQAGNKDNSKNQQADSESDPESQSQNETSEADDTFYSGFDGSTDFSLLLPSFRAISVSDESIAKVESIEVSLSESTIKELLEEAKKKDSSIDEERFKRQFGRKRTTYKVSPLKAGKVILRTSSPSGGGGRGRPNDAWNKSGNITLVVAKYTQEKVAAGKKRYETDGGGGNLRACKSCHQSGEAGAPPHELGRVMEISDKSALQWITTGQTAGRKAKIQHTWEFNSDDEEQGIVAYLRSLQTHDVEALTKLYFEQAMAEGQFIGGGRPRSDSDSGNSNTNASTQTNTNK